MWAVRIAEQCRPLVNRILYKQTCQPHTSGLSRLPGDCTAHIKNPLNKKEYHLNTGVAVMLRITLTPAYNYCANERRTKLACVIPSAANNH